MKNNVIYDQLIVGVVCLSYENAGAAPKHRFSRGTVLTYRHHAVDSDVPG
jgi:hypothetical protein